MDVYFRNHAWPNHDAGLNRCYVAEPPTPSQAVAGFYTLSATAIESAAVAPLTSRRLPKYPTPAILIGRFAVATAHQGRGLGRSLLRDALVRSARVTEQIGAFGVLLDALDEAAAAFYLRHGFTALRDRGWPRPMFLPMETLRQALPAP